MSSSPENKMEEQSERKVETTVSEEPIKAEGAVDSPDTSERSDGAASPPPNCSICLGKLVNTSFTDSCLHQFCFTCLLQWSKIKTECPLCKQTFKSIIHNVRSEEDYDQYHVPRELASQVATATLDVNFDIVGGVGTVGVGTIGGNWDIGVRRFMYRSTLGNPNRRMGMFINPYEVARREQLPSIAPQLSRDERRRRQINPSDFRRNVYRHGVWASPLPDVFGRFRECSAELYRLQPAEINRLIPWLNRELQVLLNNNAPHVAYVLRVIIDALSRYDIRSTEFRNLVRPYFGIHTEHFAHELANFARTSFDMVGYDQSVVYLPGRGFINEYGPRILSPVSSSSSMTSDDSDVRVVDDTVERRGLNIRFSALMPHSIDMPGPSTVGRAFHPYVPQVSVPDVVTVSSSSSGSEDECEVIGYVKPRHERTPEIIDLSNSETETVVLNPELNERMGSHSSSTIADESQPSTSQEVKRQAVRKVENGYPSRMLEILSSSSYTESDSDSDYSPKRKHKVSSKKSKRSSQNLQTRKRKRSTAAKRVKIDRLLSTNTFSSSSDSDSKHTKRTPKKKTKRRRSSVSTVSSSEKSKTRNTKNKSRKIKHTLSVAPKENDDIKREKVGSNSDTPIYSSSSSSSSSESDIEENPDLRKSRRSYSSSSDSSTARSRSSSKSKEKSRETRRTSNKSGTRNSRLKKSESDSETSCRSQQGTRNSRLKKSESESETSCKSAQIRRNSRLKKNESESETSSDSLQIGRSSSVSRTAAKAEEFINKLFGYKKTSTDSSVGDLEQHRYYRSQSQCSVCSDNTRTNKNRSKHKEERNYKAVKSSIKFFHPLEGNSMNSSTVSSSSKNDVPSTSKHSESKSSSSSRSRDKHKTHKKNKDSRRRRTRSNSRSKSKKKATRQILIDFQM